MSTPLCLAEGQLKYAVHPVVVFSILDAFRRRPVDQEYVIGTIMGERDGNTVTIKECFPVRYVSEDGELVRFSTSLSLFLSLFWSFPPLACPQIFLLRSAPTFRSFRSAQPLTTSSLSLAPLLSCTQRRRAPPFIYCSLLLCRICAYALVQKLQTPHHATMTALNKRVNSRLQVLGWFSTAERTDAAWTQINEAYCSLTTPFVTTVAATATTPAVTAHPFAPIILAVNTSLRKDSIDVTCYAGKKVSFGAQVLHTRFDALPYTWVADEATRIGIDAIINGVVVPGDTAFDAPSTIRSDDEAVFASLNDFKILLDKSAAYLADVAAGKVTPNAEVGRMLAAALAAVPQLDPAVRNKSYGVTAGANSAAAVAAADAAAQPSAAAASALATVTAAAAPSATMNDMLLTVYLSKVASTQVGLADRVAELLQ